MKQAVHFGAGSIGRGLVGDLLARTGYQITFVDTNPDVVDLINQQHGYHLYVIEKDRELIEIKNCQALNVGIQYQAVLEAISTCDLVTTSVLTNNLKYIAPVIAEGLKLRKEQNKNLEPVLILACENAANNSHILKENIECDFNLDSIAIFADTEVDRLVLPSEIDDGKSIDIGQDYELVIDQNQCGDRRPIKDAIYTDNMEAYLRRKLFIINGGHVIAGMFGNRFGYHIMQDVFQNPILREYVAEGMDEIAQYVAKDGVFTLEELRSYIQFALNRFSLPTITDYVKRVCRSPKRKLGREERLITPLLGCYLNRLPYKRLLQGVAASFLYDEVDDEAVQIQNSIEFLGLRKTIENVTGLVDYPELVDQIEMTVRYWQNISKVEEMK